MENPGRKVAKWAFIGVSCLTLVAAGLVAAGVLDKDSGRWNWLLGWRSQNVTSRVTYVERFTKCNDSVLTVKDVPRDEIPGLLSALTPDWKTTVEDDGAVRVVKEQDDFCPEHKDFRFLVLYRTSPSDSLHLCVFRGKKVDPVFLVREEKQITADRLYPRERAELTAGVVVPSPEDETPGDVDEKVTLYLQGISERR